MEIFQRPIIKTVLMYFINTIANKLNNVFLLIHINLYTGTNQWQQDAIDRSVHLIVNSI